MWPCYYTKFFDNLYFRAIFSRFAVVATATFIYNIEKIMQ